MCLQSTLNEFELASINHLNSDCLFVSLGILKANIKMYTHFEKIFQIMVCDNRFENHCRENHRIEMNLWAENWFD